LLGQRRIIFYRIICLGGGKRDGKGGPNGFSIILPNENIITSSLSLFPLQISIAEDKNYSSDKFLFFSPKMEGLIVVGVLVKLAELNPFVLRTLYISYLFMEGSLTGQVRRRMK
jgi:hypothetical protein